MVEQNPLQAIPTVTCSSNSDEVSSSNKKGRPRKVNVIKFGPQPQSMVSQFLKLNKTKAYSPEKERKRETNQNEDSLHNHEKCITDTRKDQSLVNADSTVELTNEEHYYVTISIPSTPICVTEPEQTVDEVNHKKPKRLKKNKLKQPGKPEIYSCDFESCSYSTKLASNMTKHKRVHSGEKPYLCDRCSFRSNFINSLKSHKRLHTELRPYKCTECSYSCNSISNLKKHRHTRHKVNQKEDKTIQDIH